MERVVRLLEDSMGVRDVFLSITLNAIKFSICLRFRNQLKINFAALNSCYSFFFPNYSNNVTDFF